MREGTVGSVSENAVSILVGEFVNDAKRVVEDAWQWTALMEWVDIPIILGTHTYALNSINAAQSAAPLRSRSRPRKNLLDGTLAAYVTTLNYEHQLYEFQLDAGYNLLRAQQNQSVQAIPEAMTFLPSTYPYTAGVINKSVMVTPTPDRNLTLRIYFTNPQEPLVAAADVLIVPDQPVIQLAYLYSLYERGEELGEFIGLTRDKATQALQDAIAHDQSLVGYSPSFYVDTSIPQLTLGS